MDNNNGRSLNVEVEGEGPLGAQIASRAKDLRQMSLSQIDPRFAQFLVRAQDQVKESIVDLIDAGYEAAFTNGAKIKTQFYTPGGVLMDAVVTLKVDCKPAPPPKDEG